MERLRRFIRTGKMLSRLGEMAVAIKFAAVCPSRRRQPNAHQRGRQNDMLMTRQARPVLAAAPTTRTLQC